MERLKIIQEIAVANSEQLRLNQIANGMMVLEMKDARDCAVDCSDEEARNRNDAALDANMEKIMQLEQQLSTLDEELEATSTRDV